MGTAQDVKIDRHERDLQVLTEVAKILTSARELKELLGAIMTEIISELELAEIGAIMLWDQPAGIFRPWAAFGYDLEILGRIGLRAGESITGKVYEEGKARLIGSADAVASAMEDMRPANRSILERALGTYQTPICSAAIPIMAGGEKFGVLVLEILSGPQVFDENDLPFLQTIANLIALAIQRARLDAQANAVRQARESERMRSELMATLSHELRMPLTAIKGYSTALLLDEVEWSAEKQAEFLRLIEAECDSMEVMLTDILDSALIEVSQLRLDLKPMRLEQIANEIAAELMMRANQHHLIVDFPPIFPLVPADPHWIRQVFRNILDNAIKYSPGGGLIVIRGEVRPTDVVVEISDQGMGISPEDLIPLFEKYFRARSPTVAQVPGTGLGLPIARSIVEAHGGRIWAESKVGQGTTLSFSLPIRPDPMEAVRKGDS